MARPFSPATAEQVVAAVEAVVVNRGSTGVSSVAEFSDLTPSQAKAALELATDLGLLAEKSAKYSVSNPLCRFLVTPNELHKAATLRVVLESYEPFVIFRERLVATSLAAAAAHQTKAILGLTAHREEIKDTLLSLGTYSHALITEGAGHYRPQDSASESTLENLARACEDEAAAEARIREQLESDAATAVSRSEVVLPLAGALLRAKAGDSRGAVVTAGNAIESYLEALASRLTIEVAAAPGINAKLEKFAQANKLPKKLIQVGKYLGHVRNAADHGIDNDVNAAWGIRRAIGVEYVFVACSFIAAVTGVEKGKAGNLSPPRRVT